MKVGNQIYFSDKGDSSLYQTWTITGTPVQNSSVWTLPVKLGTTTKEFTNNEQILFSIVRTATDGTSGTSGANGTNGTSGAAGTSGVSFSGTAGVSGGTFVNQPDYLVRTVGASTVQSVSFLYADTTNSRFGVGTTSPSAKLDVNGNVSGVSIYASDDIVAYSDARVKGDIQVIENAIKKVKEIRGVTFVRTDREDTQRHAGVIAQEVEKVLPEVISEDNLGMKNVAYGNMVGLLIEAIKEQQSYIDDLEIRLGTLEEVLNNISMKIGE